MVVETVWETRGGDWNQQEQAVQIPSADADLCSELRPSQLQPTTEGPVSRMIWQGAVKQGEHRYSFTLITQRAPDAPPSACLQLADNAAALALPAPAVTSVGEPITSTATS